MSSNSVAAASDAADAASAASGSPSRALGGSVTTASLSLANAAGSNTATTRTAPTNSGSGSGSGDVTGGAIRNSSAGSGGSSCTMNITDAAVLEYLRKKGLGSAVLELTQRLEGEQKKKKERTARDRLDDEDAINRNQRSLLAKSTGGNYGYDRDAAWPIVQWGVPDNVADVATTANAGTRTTTTTIGVDEARAYLDAFVTTQLWVLSLPDDTGTTEDASLGWQSVVDPIQRAHALLTNNGNPSEVSLKMVMKELIKPTAVQQQKHTEPANSHNQKDYDSVVLYNLAPSAKPELLAVTFALLVHTYCELLEVGMESTAHTLRDGFQPVYEPLYGNEYRDLYQCTTTEDMMRLNSHNSQHMEALATLKTILVQVSSYQLRREELRAQTTVNGGGDDTLDDHQRQLRDQKVADYDRHIAALQQKYNELSHKASAAFDKMYDLPFLRRARAVRWQLTLSTTTYGLLAAFFSSSSSSSSSSLLAMSALLQTKCELHVEHRHPLPFTPVCVLDNDDDDDDFDNTVMEDNENNPDSETSRSKTPQRRRRRRLLNLNQVEIDWAAPGPRWKDETKGSQRLPFPQYHLEAEYDTENAADRDRAIVEFNRALLINGFRRLEALERKREYEVLPPSAQKRMKEGDGWQVKRAADPLTPTILMTTLSSSHSTNAMPTTTSGSPHRPKPLHLTSHRSISNACDVSSIWEEAGIGLVCAKLCEPDGRRIAVGCDDSAVRIWSAMGSSSSQSSTEPLQVLLGHKNGFPVFDVDWNRDGRSLLSAGGDGSVRLWDTMAVGPFGVEATATGNDQLPSHVSLTSTPTANDEPDAMIPGLRPENDKYTSGTALAVYRGHAPSAPVWSVAFSPSGYYFASSGADATARLWTTDRPAPVRLFTGHSSLNVNCVEWHPNCNYVITGSDDRTARLWDIQTGRTVRLLTGCSAGVNAVQIDPSGRCAAVADYNGVVHIWDLGTGKRVTEFRSKKPDNHHRSTQAGSHATIHALKFSSCGAALATGGDDCCVRIWDVRSDTLEGKPLVVTPTHSFPTRQTMILDLFYTKRNLLLSAGKYVTPVPVAPDG